MSAEKATAYLTRSLERLAKKEQETWEVQRRVPTSQNEQRLRRLRKKINKVATCLEALSVLSRANERNANILRAWKKGAYKSVDEMLAALEAT